MPMTVNSLSDDWSNSPKWAVIPKHFALSLTDDTGRPVAGQSASVTAPAGVKAEVVNTEVVSDDNGYIDLLVLLDLSAVPSGSKIVTLTFTAEGAGAGTGTGNDNSATFDVYIDEMLIRAPRIPAALDGVIDDEDVKGGIFVYIIDPNLERGNIVNLCWDNEVISQTVKDNDSGGSYLFDMTDYTESLLTNGNHTVSAYVVDNALNAAFTDTTTFLVRRNEGGGGLPYLDPASIPAGEDGVINEKDMYAGISIVITDTSHDPEFEHSVTASSAGAITLLAFSKAGVQVASFPDGFDLATGSNEKVRFVAGTENNKAQIIYTFPPNDATLLAFLKSLGEGTITVSYSLTIGDNEGDKSYSASSATRYYVDVTPPGF